MCYIMGEPCLGAWAVFLYGAENGRSGFCGSGTCHSAFNAIRTLKL